MAALIVGLMLFGVVHSVHIVADAWRSAQIARWGLMWWRMVYSLLSLAGFALMVWGYGQARMTLPDLWMAPYWMRYVTIALMFFAFVLWLAALVPGTRLKAWVGQPAAAGVVIWALAHLLTNTRVADLLLFGSLLIWAALSVVAGRRRNRALGLTPAPTSPTRDLLVMVSAGVFWVVFIDVLHASFMGVAPLS